ncbi:MAG: hypothetical protein ACK5NK_09205 [Niabella sp.]
MKKNLTVLLLLLSANTLFSQNANTPITVEQSFWGTRFTQDGQNLKMKQLLSITQNNTAAYGKMKKARSNNTVGTIIGSIGGFMVGYTLGTAISGKPNWAVAEVGAGLIGVSIPFSVSAVKHAKKGAALYNEGVSNATANNLQLNVGSTQNGIGLYCYILIYEKNNSHPNLIR